MIAPKVEPLSELLKYKLLAVSVRSISVNFHEEESNILLQVMSPYLQLPSMQCILKLCGHNNLAFSICSVSYLYTVQPLIQSK